MENQLRVLKLKLSAMIITAQFSEMNENELKRFLMECETEYFFINLNLN